MNTYITEEKLAYSIEEFSLLSTLSKPKIRKDIRLGILKSRKIGSRRIILKEEAIRYLNTDDSIAAEKKEAEDK